MVYNWILWEDLGYECKYVEILCKEVWNEVVEEGEDCYYVKLFVLWDCVIKNFGVYVFMIFVYGIY